MSIFIPRILLLLSGQGLRTSPAAVDGHLPKSINNQSRVSDGQNARIEAVASTSTRLMLTTTWICTMLSPRVPRRRIVLEAGRSPRVSSMAEAMPGPVSLARRRRRKYLRPGRLLPVGLAAGNDRAARHALSCRRPDLLYQAGPQPLRHRP